MAGLAVPRPHSDRLRRPAGTPRVLIADADVGRRRTLRHRLELAGVEVVAEAVDGAEAIAKTASYRPSAVVLDDVLPLRRGVDALPRIRRLVPHALICMYAPTGSTARELARRRGADELVDDGVEAVVDLVNDHFAIVL
jgi:DNA-binding NarL/FixJ family response regulator